MENVKIVLDSSADLTSMEGVDFAYAPLKIVTADREYVDDETLDVRNMAETLSRYKGRSSTSCPNVKDWLRAFGQAETVFCITITSGLSGSYNAALTAKKLYEDQYPDRRVEVIDSLTAGPEIALMAEKLRDLILAGEDADSVMKQMKSYKTELLFIRESLNNFANNGRVSKVVAATVGVLGIRVVGRASEEGTLEVLSKCRGLPKALTALVDYMKEHNYQGKKVRISHVFNWEAAEKLSEKIREHFPKAEILIRECRGLCSFYAEKGGMLVGFEA